ncbi:glycosyltransferase family 4 protein [Mucilaginibacter lacusdianchii]|uniref:glycosyltransferase family 4 protein n=1 Tax=Mucilaginibacter lacusdianchii TaxID=2684211 RepID=UPI00131D4696|nr:glycosyltransferase family 4 protein [Mucilaginibacter sp. JXJ CY 39]
MYRVLYVFGGEKASGAEIVIDRLMQYNCKEVCPHLFVAPGQFAEKVIKINNYPVTTSGLLKKLNRSNTSIFKFILQAIRSYIFLSVKVLVYINRNKIDIVHANTVVPASYIVPALLLSKIFYPKVKWVWSDHDLNYFSKKDNFFASSNARLYDQTLAVSEAVKKKYWGNQAYSKVHVLYNGLDCDQFKLNLLARNNFRSKYSIDEDTVLLGIAGNLTVRKGQLSLLQTLNATSIDKKVYLLIAGSIPQEDQVYANEVINLTKQEKSVATYVGPIEDMVAFYSGCDIIISNSNIAGSEPLGTTIYEAMACEKLVIAANTGGTSEIIDHNVNGFLFEAEEYKDLKARLELCVKNFNELSELKVMARNKVLTKFNIVAMANSYNDILNANVDSSLKRVN